MKVHNLTITEIKEDKNNYYIVYTINLENDINVENQACIYNKKRKFITSFERLQGMRPEKIYRLLNEFCDMKFKELN